MARSAKRSHTGLQQQGVGRQAPSLTAPRRPYLVGGAVLDVVVLSSLRDPKGSRYFFLDPSVTSFAIELASLGPTFELGSCRTMFLLPLQVRRHTQRAFACLGSNGC